MCIRDRIERAAKETPDIGLSKMLFDYGRYLLISCSRPGGLPATLQGIWNQDFTPPWESKYTININTEMNYWLAESCNLSECNMPLFDLLERMVENGRRTAEKMYGCRGFVAHHNTDIHGDTAKLPEVLQMCIRDRFYHDCSLLFDDDDRVYLASGNKNIRLVELKKDMSGPKEGGIDRIVVSDEGNPNLGYEGTHFYKINGKYYLFFIHSLRSEWKRVEACFVSDSLEGEFIGKDVLNEDVYKRQ